MSSRETTTVAALAGIGRWLYRGLQPQAMVLESMAAVTHASSHNVIERLAGSRKLVTRAGRGKEVNVWLAVVQTVGQASRPPSAFTETAETDASVAEQPSSVQPPVGNSAN